MGILDEGMKILEELTIRNCKQEVLEAIAYLRATRQDLGIVFSDREWLLHFVVYRPDQKFVERENPFALPYEYREEDDGPITKKLIIQWIEEAITDFPQQVLPDLPEGDKNDPWYGVKINEKYYCCGCRSLYEGEPITEGQAFYLQNERDECDECAECGCTL